MIDNVIPVTVARIDKYDILIQDGVFSQIGAQIFEEYGAASVVVITDKNVSKLYGDLMCTTLTHAGLLVKTIVLPAGEKTKSLFTARRIYKQLLELETRRRTILIAFGGGMIIDTVGYVAATFMRGIPYINVPTSLLAQVDSAIGGKVAVNHSAGKNLVGAFHHPQKVFSDPTLLKTLSFRDLRGGMAEVIKTAIISDLALFEYIEANVTRILNRDIEVLEHIISRTSQLKVQLLEPDPYEVDLKRVLNFGHTVGHAVEKEEVFKIRHGEAVAVGMAVATQIAMRKGICNQESGLRIIHLIKRMGLPIITPVPVENIWDAVSVIKMIRDGNLNFVLPVTNLGTVIITNDIEKSDIVDAINELKNLA